MKKWILLAVVFSSGLAHAALPADLQIITDLSPDDQLLIYSEAYQYQLRLTKFDSCMTRDPSIILPVNLNMPSSVTATPITTPVVPTAIVTAPTAVTDINRILINAQAIIIDQSSAASTVITANYQTDEDKLMRLTLTTDNTQTKFVTAAVDYLEYRYTNTGSLVSPIMAQAWVDVPSTSYTCKLK